jgi:hypothetical protein
MGKKMAEENQKPKVKSFKIINSGIKRDVR